MSNDEEALSEYNAKRRAIGLLPISLDEARKGRHHGFDQVPPAPAIDKMRKAGDAMASLLEHSRRGPPMSVDIDDALDAWADACKA
jgi:hypothetical protein